MAIFSIRDKIPQIDPSTWIAESAFVAGDVLLEKDVSIWPGASLRGDIEKITVRSQTNIQDNAVLHTDPGAPLSIGERVTVGHGAILHGCRIGDDTLIGMGATILNHSEIGKHCLVGAGTLITENKSFPDGVLIMGRPGRVVRALSEDEKAKLSENTALYVEHKAQMTTDMKRIK